MLYSYGYETPAPASVAQDQYNLLVQNISLVLRYSDEIIACRDYFFCELAFAWCSWPYVSGDGPLQLGHLLLAWSSDRLIGKCSACSGKVLVTSFGGSILSGSNSWSGYCMDCESRKNGWWENFHEHWKFTLQSLRQYPLYVREFEEFDGQEFCWGGNGLRPARKTRRVWRRLATPVTLEVLIEELNQGRIRINDRPLSCEQQPLHLKFSRRRPEPPAQ